MELQWRNNVTVYLILFETRQCPVERCLVVFPTNVVQMVSAGFPGTDDCRAVSTNWSLFRDLWYPKWSSAITAAPHVCQGNPGKPNGKSHDQSMPLFRLVNAKLAIGDVRTNIFTGRLTVHLALLNSGLTPVNDRDLCRDLI